MEERPIEEQLVHQEIIDLLKKSIYNYPNASRPTLMTFVNHPLKNKAVRDNEGSEYYPDIVIINTQTNKIVMIGEVETISSLNESEIGHWQTFTKLSPVFYLFYPKGQYSRMSELCKKVPLTGFFEYEKINSQYTVARRWPC
ncbi:MAG: hypothetical protein KGZ86_03880 [Candidatus Latescibacteria bacterium]|nr:hypothetical protein [Candidatus Latescibacterota bacterium]